VTEVVLVTGGAGFIGSHLSARLADSGRNVRVLDDLSTGHYENIEPIMDRHPGRVSFIKGDVRDLQVVEEAMRGVVEVLHQAALPSVERSIRDPWTSHQVNVDGTVQLLEACRRAGVRRFVLAGSSSVYGDQPQLPKRETMRPSPMSPYALTKLIAEDYVRLYAELYGLPGLTLRYFNVFGPRQDPASPYAAVIPLFLQAILSGTPPTIYGDGHQTRDFTFIENVVEANVAALGVPLAQGQAMNIACGVQTSLLDLMRELCAITGREVQPNFAPPRIGDVRDSVADVSLARNLIGYAPRIDLREGLRRTVEAYEKQLKV
jgi:nucleoside-diphosphate-sugar epimerase